MVKKTIFVTGGAGVLGDALIESMVKEYNLICLTRKSSIRDARVQSIHGDITKRNFGWSNAMFRKMARQIDWIIHSAAITRLDGDEGEIFSTNYVGTYNVLSLAARARKPLYHISTAYTHACDYYEGVGPATAYEWVKRKAESMVLESDVCASIFRPSIIIGDSKSGIMPSFQGFHLTMGLVASGVLPILPCPPNAFVDVIARDVVASAIKAALDAELVGEHHFLTSGDRAPQIFAVVDLLCDMASNEVTQLTRPKCMYPDVFERLIKPVFLSTMPDALRPMLLRASLMCRYASLRTPLPSSLGQLLRGSKYHERDAFKELQASIKYMKPRLRAFTRLMRSSTRKMVIENSGGMGEFV